MTEFVGEAASDAGVAAAAATSLECAAALKTTFAFLSAQPLGH